MRWIRSNLLGDRACRPVQPLMDLRRLVFLDETGAKTNLTRTHGRSLEGTRLVPGTRSAAGNR